MMSTRSLLRCSPLVLWAAFGCGESVPPTAIAEPFVAGPRANFTNGPSTPNVFRYEGGILEVLFDRETSLVLTVGLPADPTDVLLFCGGLSELDLVPIQHAGLLQDAFNTLILARDVHIHVWHVTANDFCIDPPIAQGTGTFTFRDNDRPNVGPGSNTWGFSIQGTLDDLIHGGKVRVIAAEHSLILPDGSFRVLRQSIDLHPIGKK